MDHFRSITRNQIVVMGQKTFESIGRPLVNRLNIVISDNPKFQYDGVLVYNDIQKLIDDYKNKHIYIIGGKTIYEIFAPIADELIVSKIKKTYNCNRHLNIDFSKFNLVNTQHHPDFVAEW
jgi:dihydrofolate reductase